MPVFCFQIAVKAGLKARLFQPLQRFEKQNIMALRGLIGVQFFHTRLDTTSNGTISVWQSGTARQRSCSFRRSVPWIYKPAEMFPVSDLLPIAGYDISYIGNNRQSSRFVCKALPCGFLLSVAADAMADGLVEMVAAVYFLAFLLYKSGLKDFRYIHLQKNSKKELS